MTELEPILGLIGSRLRRIDRVFYVLSTPDESKGAVQFLFDQGSWINLDSETDGYRLKLTTTRWVDPFQEPLSRENREFVREAGRWTAFDVSSQEPYSRFVNCPLTEVTGIQGHDGSVAGVVLAFGNRRITAFVEADELYVTVDPGDPLRDDE